VTEAIRASAHLIRNHGSGHSPGTELPLLNTNILPKINFSSSKPKGYCGVQPGLTLANSTFYPHSIFVCFYGSQNKQLLLPYTGLTDYFFNNRSGMCLLLGTS
jgi:hypothetical protein